jgi:hypothetical protein
MGLVAFILLHLTTGFAFALFMRSKRGPLPISLYMRCSLYGFMMLVAFVTIFGMATLERLEKTYV